MGFVHPSYLEATREAACGRAEAAARALLEDAVGADPLWVRLSAIGALASLSSRAPTWTVPLLARLAEDQRARGSLAYKLGMNYSNLDAEGRRLAEGLAREDPAARGRLAQALGYNYENLDAEGRRLVEGFAADDPSVRAALAQGLGRNAPWLDDAGATLLGRIALDPNPAVRRPALDGLRRAAASPGLPAFAQPLLDRLAQEFPE
jgi:hypothetical protein